MPKVAIPDVVEAAKDADVLIFVVPHQFIRTICSTLLGKIKPTAVGLSLIKVIAFCVLSYLWKICFLNMFKNSMVDELFV